MATVTPVPAANLTIGKLISRISKYGDDLRNVGLDALAASSTDFWAISDFSDNETFKNHFITGSTTLADTAMAGLQINASTLSSVLRQFNSYAASNDGITSFDAFLTDQKMMVPENFADVWYNVYGQRITRSNIAPSQTKKATTTTYANALGTVTYSAGVATEVAPTASATLSTNIAPYFPICAQVTSGTLNASATATATFIFDSDGSTSTATRTLFNLAHTVDGDFEVGDYTFPAGGVFMDESKISSGTITFATDENTFTVANSTIHGTHYVNTTKHVRYVYLIGTQTIDTVDYIVGQKLAITGATTTPTKTLTYASADLLCDFKSSTNVAVIPMYYGYSSLVAADPGSAAAGTITLLPYNLLPETYAPTLGADAADWAGIFDDGTWPSAT